MKSISALKIAVLLVLLLVSFWIGSVWGSHGVVTYKVYTGNESRPVSFNLDWPTYGLPLAEYELFLGTIRQGDCEVALSYMESSLDLVLYDASQRRRILKGQDLHMLDKAIAKVAGYRKRFPRKINGDAESVAKVKSEVDSFLAGFEKARSL